jgi:hypothetical protein
VSICDMDLEEDIRQTMRVYANMHLWMDDLCPRSVDAQASVGLKSKVTVKVVSSREAPRPAAERLQEQDPGKPGRS